MFCLNYAIPAEMNVHFCSDNFKSQLCVLAQYLKTSCTTKALWIDCKCQGCALNPRCISLTVPFYCAKFFFNRTPK